MAKKDSIEVLKTKIKLLKGASNLIKNNREEFICRAISASSDKGWGSFEQSVVWNLRDYIGEGLNGHGALRPWLKSRKRYNNIDKSPKAMREYRLQWIDWMLSCLAEDLLTKKANTR